MGIPVTSRQSVKEMTTLPERLFSAIAGVAIFLCPLSAGGEEPIGLAGGEEEGAATRQAMEAAMNRLNQLGATNLPQIVGDRDHDAVGGEKPKGDKIDVLLDQAEERGTVFQALLDSIPDDLKPEWLRGAEKSISAPVAGGRGGAGGLQKDEGGETSWTIHVGAVTGSEGTKEEARPSPSTRRGFE